MSNSLDKRERVRKELLQAGVTAYGIRKSESKALWDHIGDNEHVLAAIYGQFEATSAMMVATNHRMLFIDIRALHNIVEENGYELFGDLRVDEGLVFSRVTIRTRPREFVFRMVNKRCARRFVNVIEEYALTPDRYARVRKTSKTTGQAKAVRAKASIPNDDEIAFLLKNNIGTLSTRGEAGYPYGVTVYYFYDKDEPDFIYSVTKSSTISAENIRKHPKVAYTITDVKKLTTMHVTGDIEVVKDHKRANQILGLLFTYRKKLSKAAYPPVIQIKEGNFVIYKTRIKSITLRSYLD